jgi:hypothetical protein
MEDEKHYYTLTKYRPPPRYVYVEDGQELSGGENLLSSQTSRVREVCLFRNITRAEGLLKRYQFWT